MFTQTKLCLCVIIFCLLFPRSNWYKTILWYHLGKQVSELPANDYRRDVMHNYVINKLLIYTVLPTAEVRNEDTFKRHIYFL